MWMSEGGIDVDERRSLSMECDPWDVVGLCELGKKVDVVGVEDVVVVGLEDDACTAVDGEKIAEVLSGVGSLRKEAENAEGKRELLLEREEE